MSFAIAEPSEDPDMARLHLLAVAPVALVSLLVLMGCGAPELGTPETFHWVVQPIMFRPPPATWRREGDLSGGRRGVRFVKERSVGEAISVGEYYPVGDRDRRAELHDLGRRVDALTEWELRNALSRARWRTDDTFSASEAATAEAVNTSIDRALDALVRGDRRGVERELKAAEISAAGLCITLDQVVGEVEFRPEGHPEPERYRVIGRSRIRLANLPARRVDYEVRTPEGLRRCSEVYVMHENHLFIASYIGLGSHLPLYERVIASIVFPPSEEPGT